MFLDRGQGLEKLFLADGYTSAEIILVGLY